MELLLALVLPVLVLAAWALERRERFQERVELVAAHERERDVLLAANTAEREQWLSERALLLNRIKPETAQYVPLPNVHAPPPVVLDDDSDDYWQEGKDDLAERLMAEELAEQHEHA